MNSINFTGIKNTGFVSVKTPSPDYTGIIEKNCLLVQLTDENEKDLSAFNKVISNCQPELGKCTFPYDKSFVNIYTSKYLDRDSIPELFVNFKKVPVIKKTMPLFDFISDLTKKLSNMKTEEFKINQCFKDGDDGDMFICPDARISEFTQDPAELSQIIENIYSPHSVKAGAKLINAEIQTQMYDYLEI